MRRLLNGFLSWLYPEGVSCAFCAEELKAGEEALCAACRAALPRFPGVEAVEGLEGFTAGLLYEGSAARAVRRLKYENARYLAPVLAGFIEIPESWRIGAILPVPLHEKKRKRRGYNQAELLAEALGKRCGYPVLPGLARRVKDTQSQINLPAEARRENLAAAFRASGCAGRRLLLIDDVCTTGSTLSALAEAVRAAGAEAVFGAAVCFAKIHHGKG